MREKVKQLLAVLGYYTTQNGEVDEKILETAIRESTEQIKKFCNISIIDCATEPFAVKNAAGIYLKFIKNTGRLKLLGISEEAGIKSISEGDVSVSYNNGLSEEDRLDKLISDLCDRKELIGCRKISW